MKFKSVLIAGMLTVMVGCTAGNPTDLRNTANTAYNTRGGYNDTASEYRTRSITNRIGSDNAAARTYRRAPMEGLIARTTDYNNSTEYTQGRDQHTPDFGYNVVPTPARIGSYRVTNTPATMDRYNARPVPIADIGANAQDLRANVNRTANKVRSGANQAVNKATAAAKRATASINRAAAAVNRESVNNANTQVNRSAANNAGASVNPIAVNNTGATVNRAPVNNTGATVNKAPVNNTGATVNRAPVNNTGATVDRAPVNNVGATVSQAPINNTGTTASRSTGNKADTSINRRATSHTGRTINNRATGVSVNRGTVSNLKGDRIIRRSAVNSGTNNHALTALPSHNADDNSILSGTKSNLHKSTTANKLKRSTRARAISSSKQDNNTRNLQTNIKRPKGASTRNRNVRATTNRSANAVQTTDRNMTIRNLNAQPRMVDRNAAYTEVPLTQETYDQLMNYRMYHPMYGTRSVNTQNTAKSRDNIKHPRAASDIEARTTTPAGTQATTPSAVNAAGEESKTSLM